jgi:hypothetical protein
MVYKAASLGLVLTLFATVGATATEILVDIEAPTFALGSEDWLTYARYETGDVTTELTQLDDPHMGYWEGYDHPEIGPGDDMSAFIEDVGDCGNDDQCTPWVATFSVPLDAASVLFNGVANVSGSQAKIISATFFLEAWSGPNGTGTLLGSASDPGFSLDPPANDYTLHPVTVALSAPGIRSIVFGADTITTYHGTQHKNLSWLGSLELTVVPEPSTGVLLALGLVGLARRRHCG